MHCISWLYFRHHPLDKKNRQGNLDVKECFELSLIIEIWERVNLKGPKVNIACTHCRKIRLMESNAKCRYLKNLICKGGLYLDFTARILPVWGPLPCYDPIPPLTHWRCTYSHTDGGGELTREKVRGAIVHKAGQKYQHDWLYLQSISSIEHQWRRHLGLVSL